MDIKEKKMFLEFLGKNGIDAKGGKVRIEDADKITKLYLKFNLELAKKSGLPASIAAKKDEIVEVYLDHLERNSQDHEKHHIELDAEKNYDDDTWSGEAKGTVANVWNFIIEECELDPDSVEEAILYYLENGTYWTVGR